MRASLVMVIGLGVVDGAGAGERPDPTAVERLPVPEAAPVPCDRDARCRVARFQRQLAHQRRLEYLARLEEAAKAMDERVTKAMPWRERWPVNADLLVQSNLALPGALVAYGPTWWLRLEGFAGRYSHSGGGGSMNGWCVGTQVRATPIKWALSPYVSAGWSYVGGTVTGFDFENFDSGDGKEHLFIAGAGVDLAVPWFHLSVGYQFTYAFYAQGYNNMAHDDTLRTTLQSNADDNRHGVSFSLGVAF